MKFSTILGTFALSALEANRALASPLEPVSLGAQSLEERNTEYCCMQISTSNGIQSKFIPYTNARGLVQIAKFGACEVSISQFGERPSQGGCGQWLQALNHCPIDMNVRVDPMPASHCKN
ncbi:hypothetical protein E4U30_000359 [Claviceps sp. LM220 group G6]|nr:hypothetical protein E4U15_003208 [Claviceps sp. LM218 group G6]KAG6097708.1 hypothetical protein E4U30_000359 [Claviceps sp. LM220 group G6]KAG6105415.1 hypothetical protein E4U31_001448 [Claviceps sp. LM219 group G6]